jgi:PAS domain S-box-containing protein
LIHPAALEVSMTDESQNNHTGRKIAAARFEGIIAAAMDAIISIDESQVIILFNPAAERMFRIKASEAIGSHINRFIPVRFRATHPGQVQEFGETGATHRQMGRLGSVSGLRADGEEFPAEASISQIQTDSGRIYTVIMRDISERRAAEEALRRAHEDLEELVQERTARLRDSLAEMESMSYSITHDMRAPLRAIQSFAGILELEVGPQLSEEHRSYLATMSSAAARMDALIRDVLTYSATVRRDLPIGPVDVLALLKSLVATYPAFRAPAADVRIAPGIPQVMGNIALLTQCFSNILSNAIRFGKPGEVPRIEVSGHRTDHHVRISFQDNGVGIPEHLHQKIFGIFQRLSSSHEGTGIGLAIVRKAAERMGGSVSVDSVEGQGSAFHIDLPAAPAEPGS